MIPLGLYGAARPRGLAYEGEVLADSPLAYWTHDETSGATSADETAGYPATWTGNYTRNVSPLIPTGKAVSISGVGYADASTWSAGTLAAMTVESMVSISTTGVYHTVISRDTESNESNQRCWQFRVTPSQALQFLWWTTTGGPYTATSANSAVSVGTPFHFAATYSAGVAYVYKNGTQVATQTCTSAPIRDTCPRTTLGASANTSGRNFPHQGVLDEQAIYPAALTAARLLAHAQAAGVA